MAKVADKTQVQEVQVKTVGFAGGINNRDAPNMLAQNEARAIENIILEERGAASKRPGVLSMGTFGTSLNRVLSMYTYYRGALAPQVIIHTTAGTLYYTNDPTAQPIVWTQIATGLSTSQPFSYETFNSKCYMSNGVDNYAAWDGSTWTVFPSAPKGKFLKLYKDTMWVSGIPATVDRVYQSNPGDAETFGVASWVDIAHGDGDQVTALGSDGLTLIVFKRNRTFNIYDPTTYANRVIDFEKGCESHFSIIQFESSVYFLSRRGICQYLGDAPSRYLSYKIDPIFDPAVINIANLNMVNAYLVGTRVGWAIPEVAQTQNTFQIEYYPRLAERSPDQESVGIGPLTFQRMPGHFFSAYRYQANDFLLAGSNQANKVYRCYAPAQGTDDGATFQGLIETGTMDFGVQDRTKYIRRMRFLGRGKTNALIKRNFEPGTYKTYLVDMSAGVVDLWSIADHWGVGSWGPGANVREDLVNTDAYGRYFALRFVDAEVGTQKRPIAVGSLEYSVPTGEWTIFGILLDGVVLGVRS